MRNLVLLKGIPIFGDAAQLKLFDKIQTKALSLYPATVFIARHAKGAELSCRH